MSAALAKPPNGRTTNWRGADCLTPEFPSYTCIARTRWPWRYVAVIMAYNVAGMRYEPIQTWGPLAKPEAEKMAQRWAVEAGIKYLGVWK